jgi:hypothetical protein
MVRCFAVAGLLLAFVEPVVADPRLRITPQPWTGDGQPFRDLMTQPAQWPVVRSQIDAISYYAWALNNQYSDAELTAWFAQIQSWGIELQLEVGAIKQWQADASIMFGFERTAWDRFVSLGATIHQVNMDEPFFAVRHFGLGSDQYAVDQVAEYIQLVRANFPTTKVGSIEPYPAFSRPELEWWITHLNQRLVELNEAGLDYFCLDVDWRVFGPDAEDDWFDVKALELFCRANAVPFSLIYWGSDDNVAPTDQGWYEGAIAQGAAYQAVGGKPDEYLVQSWLTAPVNTVPETFQYSFTHSVRDFSDAYVFGDADNDGHPAAIDNCPDQPNPDQTDTDADGMGDVCDPCPTHFNPLPEYVRADVDRDCDVDGVDFSAFASCYNGAGKPPRTLGCPPENAKAFDYIKDGDIDGIDFAIFATCFNGAGKPPRLIGGAYECP